MPSGLVLVAALAVAAPQYRGTPAHEAAVSAGREVVAELTVDVDGDFADEVAVVERDAKGRMRLVVFEVAGTADERVFTQLLGTESRAAERLVRFEARQLVGHRAPEIIAVFEERTPDEAVQHVRIVGLTDGGVRQMFAHTFYLSRSLVAPSVMVFGDATPRFDIEDIDPVSEDSAAEIVWIREPQILELNDGPQPQRVVIGAYKTVFRYAEDKALFLASEEVAVEDFAPAKVEWEVEASRQRPKIWGTAQAFWATDGDLDTSWSIAGGNAAVGATLTVRFRVEEPVALARLVPGCARNADTWESHDRIEAFQLELSTGKRFEVDLARLETLEAGVAGAGVFPVEDGDRAGQQVLLLLAERQMVRWARITVLRVARSTAPKKRRVGEACLSELSFH